MCAAGARGAREARFFPILTQNLILSGVFEVTFVDMTNRLAAIHQKRQNIHVFARRGRAVRAKWNFFSWINFIHQDGSNEVSHTPGKVREVCLQ